MNTLLQEEFFLAHYNNGNNKLLPTRKKSSCFTLYSGTPLLSWDSNFLQYLLETLHISIPTSNQVELSAVHVNSFQMLNGAFRDFRGLSVVLGQKDSEGKMTGALLHCLNRQKG